MAAMANSSGLIAALVAAGADVEARDEDDLTALHVAALAGPAAIAALAVAEANLEGGDHNEFAAVVALAVGNPAAAKRRGRGWCGCRYLNAPLRSLPSSMPRARRYSSSQ